LSVTNHHLRRLARQSHSAICSASTAVESLRFALDIGPSRRGLDLFPAPDVGLGRCPCNGMFK
jgi:hypothetical protein